METVLLMARARAITILTDSFVATISGFMLVWPVVACMAARTVRLESGVLPGNQIGILRMTFGTLQVALMILRLVCQRRVPIIGWRPRVRDVADVTLNTGVEVTGILTRCRHSVVTGRAGPQYLAVVNGENGREHIRRMAVFTYVGRLYVCRVLARSVRAVMAAEAVARNIHVIEIRRQPGNCAVTVIAVVAAGNMIRRLACGSDTIVTRPARAQHLRMVDHHNRRKHIRGMAVFTDVGCQGMRRVFAGGVGTVMTVDAATRNRCVIERGWQPACRRMTVIAGIAAGDMR